MKTETTTEAYDPPWEENTGPYCSGGHYNDPETCFDCAKEKIEEVRQMYARLQEIKSFLAEKSSTFKTFKIKEFQKEFLNDLSFLKGDVK
jgi:hypothetical protein